MPLYHERPEGLAKAMAKLSKNKKLQRSVKEVAEVIPHFKKAIGTIDSEEDNMNYKTYEVKVYDDNKEEWYYNNKLHREDGPAVITCLGSKFWYRNGKIHREDGPAVEGWDGTKSYYYNGERHKENGPAVEYPNGIKEWWLNGKNMTKQEWEAKVNPALCQGKIVKIDGKEYELKEIK